MHEKISIISKEEFLSFPKGEAKRGRSSTYKIFIAFNKHLVKPCYELSAEYVTTKKLRCLTLRSLHSRGPLGHWIHGRSHTRRSVRGAHGFLLEGFRDSLSDKLTFKMES